MKWNQCTNPTIPKKNRKCIMWCDKKAKGGRWYDFIIVLVNEIVVNDYLYGYGK